MSEPLTKQQVKEILSRNGINDLEQLASLIASSSLDNPQSDSIDPVASSWVIKVLKLSPAAVELPDELGGDILRGTNLGIGQSN